MSSQPGKFDTERGAWCAPLQLSARFLQSISRLSYRLPLQQTVFDGRLEDKHFQNFSPLEREIIPRVFIYSSVLGEKIGQWRWMMKINRILGSPEVSSSSRCAFLLPAWKRREGSGFLDDYGSADFKALTVLAFFHPRPVLVFELDPRLSPSRSSHRRSGPSGHARHDSLQQIAKKMPRTEVAFPLSKSLDETIRWYRSPLFTLAKRVEDKA